MYKLIPILLIPACVIAQDRTYKQVITQTVEAQITDERNEKISFGINQNGRNVCIVNTELQIDNEWHNARGESSGDTKEEACKTASILARKNLTSSIKPSTIKSIAEVTYEENGNTKHIDGYKEGEIVDINNLKVHRTNDKEFLHEGTICKWFNDWKRTKTGIKQYNLIACKTSDSWLVEKVF